MKPYDQRPDAPDSWEPQPLHLPIDVPRRRDPNGRDPREPEPEHEGARRVIVIDLA